MDATLLTYLKENNIEYTVHHHPAVFTVAESNALNLKLPCFHTKNLFLKDERERFYLLCCAADKPVDMKSLRQQLGVRKLHFGSAQDLEQQLNTTPGSVSLFAMIYTKNVRLLLDAKVWAAPHVGFHPNVN